MDAKVINIKGEDTGRKVKLPASVFAVDPNDHAIYLDVKQHLANLRQGTHKSKQRNEVAGSTKKIKRQKGTGGARAGSLKNPEFRGGGRIFGPVPRDYSFKLNKKLKKLARLSALSYKAKENGITVVEDFNFENPKTKQYTEIMKSLNFAAKKILLVMPEMNRNIYLSSRNIPSQKATTVAEINTYDILNAQNLLLLESSVKLLEKSLSK